MSQQNNQYPSFPGTYTTLRRTNITPDYEPIQIHQASGRIPRYQSRTHKSHKTSIIDPELFPDPTTDPTTDYNFYSSPNSEIIIEQIERQLTQKGQLDINDYLNILQNVSQNNI